MNTRLWLTLTLALGLTACTTPTTPDPGRPTPTTVVTTFNTKADLQAFATNLYAGDAAQRDAQVAAYITATQRAPTAATPASTLHAASLPDDILALLTVDEAELLDLQRGMGTQGGLTLDGWAKQATAFGFRAPDGGPLTADVIRAKLQALAAQDTFTPQQRPLAIVAVLSAARTEDGAPFGDDVLDPLQVLIMNNVLLAKLLEAQPASATISAAETPTPIDEVSSGLGLFKDLYGTGKELLSDMGTLLTGVKEFGEFGECTMFLVNSIEMSLTADQTALWRQGLDGPFQARLTAKANLRGDINDEDLTYYAKNGCAPSANRTFENIQTRWILNNTKNGTLELNGGPTDAQGKFVNTFTTEHDTSRAIERVPENKRTDPVTAKVLVSQLSATYPHLEWRAVNAKMNSSTNLGKTLKLNVTYYEPNPVQWRLNFRTVEQFKGYKNDRWYTVSTGELLFEVDSKRSTDSIDYLAPVSGSFSVTHDADVCELNWPGVTNYPVSPLMEWSVLKFIKTGNANVMKYLVSVGTLDQTKVNTSWTCGTDTMTYTGEEKLIPTIMAHVGDVYDNDYPTFDPTTDVKQLSGTYIWRVSDTSDSPVMTTKYTLTRVDE